MKNPGLQHQERLREMADKLADAKRGLWAARGKLQQAEKEYSLAKAAMQAEQRNFDQVTCASQILVLCEHINEDGLPYIPSDRNAVEAVLNPEGRPRE